MATSILLLRVSPWGPVPCVVELSPAELNNLLQRAATPCCILLSLSWLNCCLFVNLGRTLLLVSRFLDSLFRQFGGRNSFSAYLFTRAFWFFWPDG